MRQPAEARIQVYGASVAVVLCDDRGEFEVARAWSVDYEGSQPAYSLDLGRVADAVTARAREVGGSSRPVY